MQGRAPLIDVRQPAVTVFVLYFVAGLIGLVWMLLPHPPVDHPVALYAVSAASLVAGLAIVPMRRHRMPAWAGHLVLGCATLTVSGAVYLNGAGYSAPVFFYLWSSPYAFMGSRRSMLAHAALIGASLAAALAAIESPGAQPGAAAGLWLLVMGSVCAAGLLARKLTETLRRTSDTMMAGFMGASAGIGTVRRGGWFEVVNPALCEMLRCPREQLVGARAARFVHPDSGPAVAELSRRVRRGEPGTCEFRFVRADGTTGWAALTAVHVAGEHGDVDGFNLIQLVDVTARRQAQDELRESEQRFARLFGDAPIGQVVTDMRPGQEGRITMANPAVCQMLGASEAQLVGANWLDLLHPEDVPDLRERYPTLGDGDRVEMRLRRRDGSSLWTRLHTSGVRDDEGRPLHLITQLEDVTVARRRARQQAVVARVSREALEHRDLQRVFDDTVSAIRESFEIPFAGLAEREPDGRLALRARAGWAGAGDHVPSGGHAAHAIATGRPVSFDDFRGETRFSVERLTEFGITSGIAVPVDGPAGDCFGALALHATDGRRFTADDAACLQALASVLTSAIRREHVERELLHRSMHDPLTGLPNRGLLLDRLGRVMARAVRDGAEVSVLFLDLDDFKDVNDSLGHEAGDQLLCRVAGRLSAALRPGDLLARFGGDEFVVLCEGGSGDDHVAVARRLLGAVAEPVEVAGTGFLPRVSVGVASAVPAHGATPTSLLRDADVALYRAKGAGKNRVEIFGAQMRAETLQRVALVNELRGAVEHQQLRVAHQPIVSLDGGHVAGVEALVRWTHPRRGEMEPARFVGVAEEEGLIVQIDRWMLRRAVEQIAPLDGLGVSVNVSRRRLGRPELVAELREVLDGTGLAPQRLTLEVTESALADDPEGARRVLGEIAAMGVGVALDDFGTGQSSLSSLRDFPLRRIKLDRAFVRGLPGAALDRSIVRAVVELASSLSLDVVAEGVDCAEQAQVLRELGCAYGQGFLYSPAVGVDVLPGAIAQVDAALRGAVPARSRGAAVASGR